MGRGFTFDSGAALALLYDSLRQVGREAEYTRLRGRLAVVTHVSIATSGVLGGIVGALDLTLPFLLYAMFLLAALGLVWSLYEPPQATTARPHVSTVPGHAHAHGPVSPTAGASALHAAISALMPLAISIVGVVFLQPHARALGLPIAAMGFLVLGLHGVRSLGAAAAHRLASRFGETTWLRLVPGIVFLAMLGLGLVPTVWGLGFLAIVGLATSAVTPVVEAMILRHAPAEVRHDSVGRFAGVSLAVGRGGGRAGRARRCLWPAHRVSGPGHRQRYQPSGGFNVMGASATGIISMTTCMLHAGICYDTHTDAHATAPEDFKGGELWRSSTV